MDYTELIIDLYDSVNENQKDKFRIKPRDVKQAFWDMKEAYLPNATWEWDCTNKLVDYNSPAHRFAYTFKRASLHTGLLCTFLQEALSRNPIRDYINSRRNLSICSLGGGPGVDVVAVLMVVKQLFGFVQCRVNIIDFCREWKHVFDAIVSELGRDDFLQDMVHRRYFSYEYLGADLLNESYWNNYKVRSALSDADIITMIKFISAAASAKTRQMVRQIFNKMKNGAMLIFVDNAAGGFFEMLSEEACRSGMKSVYGPVKHHEYEERRFIQELYGYASQYNTKVTIQIWQKPCSNNTTQQLRREYMNPRRQQRPESVRLPQAEARSQNDCCSLI